MLNHARSSTLALVRVRTVREHEKYASSFPLATARLAHSGIDDSMRSESAWRVEKYVVLNTYGE
jgi:hypothetical protein